MSDQPRLELRGVSSGYAGLPAIRDLSLHVGAGEIVALLGPNGAGKTCTLLTISSLLEMREGDVLLDGTSIRGLAPHVVSRRGLAHVPEDRSLFFGLTARENLWLGSRQSGSGGRKAGLETVLTWFPELRPLVGRRAGLLSGGEQQMLALGRAMTGAPRVLLVDELSLGLAPLIFGRLLRILRHIADETGTAVLLVEQQVNHALQVSDRAYVLNHGRIVLEGSSSELAARPGMLETAYLGEVSLETHPHPSK